MDFGVLFVLPKRSHQRTTSKSFLSTKEDDFQYGFVLFSRRIFLRYCLIISRIFSYFDAKLFVIGEALALT